MIQDLHDLEKYTRNYLFWNVFWDKYYTRLPRKLKKRISKGSCPDMPSFMPGISTHAIEILRVKVEVT